MNVVKAAYATRLLGLTAITSQLAQYRSKPAIFARSKVPAAATFPYIVIRDALANEPYDTKTTVGRATVTDIGIFDTESGDDNLVEDIAELVREAFHRQPVTVSGYGSLIASASGPVVAPTEDQVYGRIVTVSLIMIKR